MFEFGVGDIIVRIGTLYRKEVRLVSHMTGAYCLVDVGEICDNRGIWWDAKDVEQEWVKVN